MCGRTFAGGWRGLQRSEGSKHLKLPNLAGLGSAEISFPERVDKGTYLPRRAVVQRPGTFRIIAAIGFDLREFEYEHDCPGH